jgi:hypothetical protein
MYVDAERRLTAIPSKSGGGNGGKRDKKRSTERAGAESACSQFRIEEAYAYSWFQNLSDSGSPGTKNFSLYKKL